MASINEEEIEATVQKLYTNSEELGNVLYALTQPNNTDLKRATLLIHRFMDKPEAIMPLVQQIETSQHAEVRQVAAVYLREQIEEFYKKVPADIKPKLKGFLITKLVSLTNRAERLAIGAAISSIAKYAFVDENEGWNELLIALEKICKPAQNTELREVGYILWRNLVSFCGGALKKHFGKILQILQVGLKDTKSIKIQVESVKSIGIMVEFLENEKEVAIIEGFIPSMVGVIDKCLKKGDEENVIAGMEVFNDLVESKVPVIHKHAEQLTKFNLKIAAAKDELPMTVRKQATNFATWMCKSKPKTVMKHNFIQPFLTLCINLVIESSEDDIPKNQQQPQDPNNPGQRDDEDDEKTAFTSPLGIACDLLDEIFLNIPSEQCFPIATKAIEKLLMEQQSNRRKAGYVLIAMMAEGCKEIIGKGDNLKMLIKACLKGITDDAMVVRKCSLEAISQICTHCNFDILQHHKMILPNIFRVFEKQNEEIRVKERALSAIEMFIDAYDPNDDNDNQPSADNDQFRIVTYLQEIMNVIGKCLETQSQELQKQAISTLSSCAQAALTNFNIYLPKVIQLLDSLMQIKDEDKIELRAEATSCLGSVAGAVGFDSFKSILPKFHQYVMDGLMEIDNSDIREASFMYFSELAEIMGNDILKLDSFEEMLNFILYVMEDDDGLMVELPDDGFKDAIPQNLLKAEDQMAEMEAMEQNQLQQLSEEEMNRLLQEAIAQEEADDDDDNADDDEEEILRNHVGQLKTIKLNVTTGFMEEKAAAVHALTSFIKNGGFGFLQHMDECWERLTYLWEYPHSLVKMSVAACFNEFFTLIVNHSLQDNPQAIIIDGKENNKKYPYEQGITIAYNSNVQNWIDTIFPLYIQAIRDETDRDALNVVVDYFIDELKVLGPDSISASMEDLIGSINLYLKEECQCQQSSDPRNNDTKEIGTKHQWISDTIADLIATLAELFGNKFASIFDKVFNNLLHFGRESRHPQDQAMVVGCIADCCSRLNDNILNDKCKNPNSTKCELMSPFSDTIYKLALRIAQSQDVNMRQNALYCMGAMATCCDTKSNLTHSTQILQCIKSYMQLPNNGTRQEKLVRDNAVSALGKVLIAEPKSLPTKDLLPIFLNSLPLTCDFTENQYVYNIIGLFIRNHTSLIQPHIEQSLGLLGLALSDNEVPQQTTNKIIDLFKTICNDSNIQTIVQTKLPQKAQENIFKALQSK